VKYRWAYYTGESLKRANDCSVWYAKLLLTNIIVVVVVIVIVIVIIIITGPVQ